MSASRKKHNHVANLNLILNELRKTTPTGGLTINELAQLCNVSKRNIYRYLNEIEEIGFELVRPVQAKPGQVGRGKYRLRKKVLPKNRVDTNLMMIIGLNALRELQYREYLKIINEIFFRYLSAKYRLSLPPDWSISDSEQNKGSLDGQQTPLQKVEVTNSTNTKKEKREIVKVMLGSNAAEIFNCQEHPFKLLRQEAFKDGSLLLTFSLNNANDILDWVFQWGDEAEIIKPRWLRKNMKKICSDIIKAYSSKYLSKKLSYIEGVEIS